MPTVSPIASQVSTLDTMISQLMALERQPLLRLQTRKSEINVSLAMFSDLRTKLNALKSLAEDLAETGSLSVFSSKTVTSSNPDVVSATAAGGAANASYSFEITTLAKAYRVQSNQQSSSTASTGYVGTIRVQDAIIEITQANNSLQGIRDAINSATYAPGRGVVASIIDNRLVIQSQATGVANTIALADLTGNVFTGLGIITGASSNLAAGSAVSVSSSAPGYEATKVNDGLFGDTNAWQSGTAGSGWVQIDLGTTRTVSRIVWGRGEATDPNDHVPQDYTIQVSNDGVNWTTVKSIADHSFASAGDDAVDVFAPVSARYVRMDITATTDGLEPILDEIEIYDDTSQYGINLTQAGIDATFTIDGVPVTRASNTGLSDVISGLSVDLKAPTSSPATLTVTSNTADVRSKIDAFLAALNDLTSYIRAKSSVTKVGETYTRGGLAGYYAYTSLRAELINAVIGKVVSSTSSYSYLSEIGITMNSDMQFVVSDSAALSAALGNDIASVAALFNADANGIANRIVALLTPYTETSGWLDDETAGLNDEIGDVDERIAQMEERLTLREQQLRTQYLALQKMLAGLMAQQSALQSVANNQSGFLGW